jgi:hypothetical protein
MSNRNLAMDSFVTDTQALVKFMMGKKVINIAASARYLDIPLITNDPVIRASEFVDILE